MAIRKKSLPRKIPLRKGLLIPSRKQRDWQQEKTGDIIVYEERRSTITAGDIVPAGAGSTVYTCPANTRAKLVYAQISTNLQEGYIQLTLKGVPNFIVHTYTPQTVTYNATFNDGVDLEPGDFVRIFCNGAGTAVGTVQVIQDEISPGYLVR